MGKRREPRKPVEVQVRIFGTDSGAKIFSENVTTLDGLNPSLETIG